MKSDWILIILSIIVGIVLILIVVFSGIELNRRYEEKDCMTNKIEIGEYVRTKDGRIAQIKSIDYEAGIYRFDRIIYINDFEMKENVLYNNEMFKKLIVKHSKQLIDLIEIRGFCKWI